VTKSEPKHDACIGTEELGELSESKQDSRWQHVESCARCRALWLEYAAFLAGDEAPGAQPEIADAALHATLREAVQKRRAAPRPAWRRIVQLLLPRPAWMVPAAAALVTLLLIYGPGEESAVRSGILRGDSSPEFAASAHIEPGVPAMLRFTWSVVAGADAYDVVFLSVDLEEVARHTAGPETSLQLALARVPHDNSGLLWRVQAYRRGDPLQSSRVAPLPLPGPARD
jgi:hypothetical protein